MILSLTVSGNSDSSIDTLRIKSTWKKSLILSSFSITAEISLPSSTAIFRKLSKYICSRSWSWEWYRTRTLKIRPHSRSYNGKRRSDAPCCSVHTYVSYFCPDIRYCPKYPLPRCLLCPTAALSCPYPFAYNQLNHWCNPPVVKFIGIHATYLLYYSLYTLKNNIYLLICSSNCTISGYRTSLADEFNITDIYGAPFTSLDSRIRQCPAALVVPVLPPMTVIFSGALKSPFKNGWYYSP